MPSDLPDEPVALVKPKRKRAKKKLRPGKKDGRPPHTPTEAQQHTVTVLAANGIPQHIIAKAIGVPLTVMKRHYREELTEAKIKVEAVMGEQIVRAARGGAWGAAKYWLVVHGDPRWRVPEQHLFGGDPNAPPIRLAVSQLTDVEIEQELAEIEQRERITAETRALAPPLPQRSNGVGH